MWKEGAVVRIRTYVKENIFFLVTLLIATILFFSGVFLIQTDRQNRKRQIIALESSISEGHYNVILRDVLHNVNTIETFVLSVGMDNIDDESFDAFTDRFSPQGVDFVSVSIAPDGIMEFYHSEEYGDGLIGLDLVNDEREHVRNAVQYAIDNNVIVVNGPFDLLQGDQGIVFRKAVFEDGEFAGLINFVVDYNELQYSFYQIDLTSVRTGIFDGNSNSVIFGNAEYSDTMYKYADIELDYVDWKLGVQIDEDFNRQESITISVMGISFVIVYFAMASLWSNYYHRTKSFIKRQNQLIHYDNLTGLPNRRLFVIETNQLIHDHVEFYLGFGDLDNFKNINDVLGHSIGDQYLIFLSDKLKQLRTKNFRIYRWGGDEFIFVFIGPKRDMVIRNIDNIFDILRTSFDINGSKHQISISIGIVHHPQDSRNLDDLVRRADIVMYDIKAHYKNTYSFFQEKYLEELYKEVEFQQELDQYTIEDFSVYYQPIIDIQTTEIVGFEGLARLFNKEGKPFNTASIIKRYEQDGTITSLDKHIFHEACVCLNTLKKEGYKSHFITFNISPLSLNYDFIDYLKRTSRSYDIDTSKIIIEIIETLGFKDVKISVELLTEIKKLGFKIAMDDFGMGYSSLSYIAQLPLDIIKIDKTFIHTYEENTFNRTILNTIQDISDSLHLKTLVEGIETKKQLDFVKDLGVEYYQGYYHSKPQPFEETLKLLRTNKKS
jgi:diguanylate cyclase (GGDEF)-like protein